jgi:hypothetical protein
MDQNPIVSAGRAHIAGGAVASAAFVAARCCARHSVHKAGDIFASRWPNSASEPGRNSALRRTLT